MLPGGVVLHEVKMNNPWALCHVDESFNASLLGNRGSQLHWFEDQQQLCQYLQEEYVDLLADTGELDEEQTEAARERFALIIEQSLSLPSMVEHLNDLASGLRRIVWLGSLAELAELDDEFANAVRCYFWGEQGECEEDPEAAIPEPLWPDLLDLMDDFLAEGEYC